MKVVLDANIVVSATISPHGHPYRALQAFRDGDFELLITSQILDELDRVLRYPRIVKRTGWSEEQIVEFLETLEQAASLSPGLLTVEVADDPDDNMYLACAIEGGADYIVTGDKSHLLPLTECQGIPIITVREFCEMLESSNKTHEGRISEPK